MEPLAKMAKTPLWFRFSLQRPLHPFPENYECKKEIEEILDSLFEHAFEVRDLLEYGRTEAKLATLPLSAAHISVIRAWTSSLTLSQVLKAAFRELDIEKIRQHLDYIWLLKGALDLMSPAEYNVAFRGEKVVMDWCLPGQRATFVCFTSLSLCVNQASTFCGQKGTFLIFHMTRQKARDVRPYAHFKNEQELLLPTNTCWTVLQVLSGQQGVDHVVGEVGSKQKITERTKERLQSQLVLVLTDSK